MKKMVEGECLQRALIIDYIFFLEWELRVCFLTPFINLCLLNPDFCCFSYGYDGKILVNLVYIVKTNWGI